MFVILPSCLFVFDKIKLRSRIFAARVLEFTNTVIKYAHLYDLFSY